MSGHRFLCQLFAPANMRNKSFFSELRFVYKSVTVGKCYNCRLEAADCSDNVYLLGILKLPPIFQINVRHSSVLQLIRKTDKLGRMPSASCCNIADEYFETCVSFNMPTKWTDWPQDLTCFHFTISTCTRELFSEFQIIKGLISNYCLIIYVHQHK